MARDTISPNSPGLDTSFAQSRPSPLQPLRYVPVSALSSRFAFSLAAGGLIATLSDPFGSGSTFSTTGTVPAQLALSGNTIVKGAGTAVIGTEYGIDIVVTSPDGVAQPAVRLLFRAALPLGGTFTGGGVTPTPTPAVGSITAMGDSIVAGEFNPSGPASYAALNRLGYGSGVTIVNKAVSGESTQTGYSRLQSGDYDTGVVANGPSIFVVEDGTNSLANFGGNISETALYTIVTNIVTLAKTKGFYVMICTLLPRTIGGVDSWSTTQEAKRVAYNNLVRNNTAGADGIIDQALNPTMGDAANSTTNTTLYVDGLHPTNAGQDALTPTWKAAIDTLIYSPRRLPALKTLSLSGALTNGTASTGNIIGTAFGSTIASNVAGLTVNSAARTYAWDGTGAVATTASGLVETLAGAPGSPKPSSVTVVAAGAAKNFLRLTTVTRLAESAGANGGYDYTPTVTLNNTYSPTAGGYPAVSLPANADGFIALQLPAVGGGGPIMGITTTQTPASLSDIGFGMYADTGGTGKYLYIVNGQSSYGQSDPTPITIAANDIMRLRRTGAVVYLEVSKDSGATFQVAKTQSATSGQLYFYFQTGSSSAQGIIRAPYASANVA